MARSISLLLLICLFFSTAYTQQIIPLPQNLEKGGGTLAIDSRTVLIADASFESEAAFLKEHFENITGISLSFTTNGSERKIVLRKQPSTNVKGAYTLDVTNSNITITAADASGAFYGCISLLQLLPAPDSLISKKTVVELPLVRVDDYPRFQWRGLMLDLSRTFMSPDYLKRIMERMAFYKLNVLHMHLTDDQGWRIPVKGYPLLIEKASKFDSSFHEPKEFEGYYTPEDIRELHEYAAALHIDLVPEIESPGHAHAALYAYPELMCQPHPSPIFPAIPGKYQYDEVFCAGNPGSLKLVKSAIIETASLFSSPYIHLGGDEVQTKYWDKCAKCLQLVKSEKLAGTQELEGYFMNELKNQAVKSGKRPVAWDEIMHHNKFLTKDWVIMSWTGSKPGLEAAAKGYDVVMTPTSHMYFDYNYSEIDTKRVFEFDPFEGGVPDSARKHILGIQANFWSHIDRTRNKIDYQIFPRLLGLAERAWSAADQADYESFRIRKIYHRKWLDFMDVKYFMDDFK